METKNQTLDVLASDFYAYLRKIQRAEKSIKMYEWVFGKIKSYMKTNRIKFYDKNVEESFLESLLGRYDYRGLPNSQKVFVNKVGTLTEFQNTGTVFFGIKKNPPKVFEGQIGATMIDFMAYRKEIFQLSGNTLNDYVHYLHSFYVFLEKEKILSFDRMTLSLVFRYIESIDPQKISTKNRILLLVKNYLRYLYEQKYLPTDFSGAVPKGKSIRRPQLPSTFTTDEIKKLLTSVDRGNPKGKRDYAILLLATKLGMRSSDIRWLKFENILWQKNSIVFKQQKTGRDITLPLLPEIGNAIIDYLKKGRPVSNESCLFLQIRSPYKHIDRSTIGDMVQFHLKRAGINCTNRKHGPHVLRHSFAGNLLSQKIPIPVISEALGHSSSQSTMDYLRIDLEKLCQCALDVPPCVSFYKQKGGPDNG